MFTLLTDETLCNSFTLSILPHARRRVNICVLFTAALRAEGLAGWRRLQRGPAGEVLYILHASLIGRRPRPIMALA